MVFKKAKLFWKNEAAKEIIDCVLYDDGTEYYTIPSCANVRLRGIDKLLLLQDIIR